MFIDMYFSKFLCPFAVPMLFFLFMVSIMILVFKEENENEEKRFR